MIGGCEHLDPQALYGYAVLAPLVRIPIAFE